MTPLWYIIKNRVSCNKCEEVLASVISVCNLRENLQKCLSSDSDHHLWKKYIPPTFYHDPIHIYLHTYVKPKQSFRSNTTLPPFISDHPLTRSTLFKFWTLLIAPTLFHNSLMDLTSFEKHFPGRPSLLTLLAFTRSNYFEALVYLCSLVWFICWEPARTSGNHCVRLCGTCRAFPQARDFPSC